MKPDEAPAMMVVFRFLDIFIVIDGGKVNGIGFLVCVCVCGRNVVKAGADCLLPDEPKYFQGGVNK